ncbi:protein ALP1-like [Helianthus annuus]|uniref:protein ALP1-like n=1 Tax=Helianthus annuus TaxID=4232 RepID=UPI00165333E7|nr:protein ALP1-like [Helianthus annuus]
MLHDLSNGGKCRELIRMSEKAFMTLCSILKRDGGLRATQRMSVEEHVATFLHIVGNDLRNWFTSWLYRRSGSTTSRCFHRVLRAIISLEGRYIQQPKGDIVPKEIQEKKRFYPFFKDCIGAIDGTHVRVKVPNKDAPRYRGRKGYPTTNVLAACTFDLKFTYVLTGWEGTASDSRIIKNALTRDDKLVIPTGNLFYEILLNCLIMYSNTNYKLFIGRYCLADAGLPHTSTLMAPYRGVRYHLKEYSTRAPENAKELFNLRHASLRNAIERAFGVLKKRFPIIRSTAEPFYSCETQSGIFLACCILHNFLLEEDRDKDLEDEVIQEVLDGPQEEESQITRDIREGSTRSEQLRNSIANEMWTNYLTYPNNEIDMSK